MPSRWLLLAALAALAACAPSPSPVDATPAPAALAVPAVAVTEVPAVPAVEVPEPPSAGITGRVKDPQGAPIVDATVCAVCLDEHAAPTPCTTTDRDGRYTLAFAAAQRHRIGAEAPGRLPGVLVGANGWEWVDLRPNERRMDGDIVLPPGGLEVRGTVRDGADQMIQGASISVNGVVTRSDPRGAFTRWTAGLTDVINVAAAGFASTRTIGGSVILRPEAVLRGALVDAASGAPIAGARVELLLRGDFPAATTRSDPLGRFEFHGLEAASYLLKAQTYARVSDGEAHAFDLAEGASVEAVVPMRASLSVRGRVATADGAPCPSGVVELVSRGPHAAYRAGVERDGGFLAADVQPGSYDVRVDCLGYAPRPAYPPIEVADTSVDDLRIPVDVGTTLRGRVVGPTAAPVVDVLVLLNGPRDRGTRTDSAGAFAFFGLAPDEYRLSVVRRGESPLLPGPGQTVTIAADCVPDEVRLDMISGATLTGHVRDPQGHPLAGLRLHLRDDDPVHRNSTKTAADGSFTLLHVYPARYEIKIEDAAGRELRAPGRRARAVLRAPLVVTAGSNPPLELVVRPAP